MHNKLSVSQIAVRFIYQIYTFLCKKRARIYSAPASVNKVNFCIRGKEK